MKKNNKGYLLTETLIVITVVATVITMVYALIVNYYIKQENEVTKFNTTEGLYIASQIEKYFSGFESDFIEQINNDPDKKGYTIIADSQTGNSYSNLISNLNIKKLYFSINDVNSIIEKEKLGTAIKKNLYESQDIDTNSCDYRYLIIFRDNSYSTVGVFCDE